MLSEARLAFRAFDRHTGALHAVPDSPDQVLILCGLEDVVVLDRVGVGREVAVALRRCRLVAFLEQEELELGAALYRVAELGRLLQLTLQHLPR